MKATGPVFLALRLGGACGAAAPAPTHAAATAAATAACSTAATTNLSAAMSRVEVAAAAAAAAASAPGAGASAVAAAALPPLVPAMASTAAALARPCCTALSHLFAPAQRCAAQTPPPPPPQSPLRGCLGLAQLGVTDAAVVGPSATPTTASGAAILSFRSNPGRRRTVRHAGFAASWLWPHSQQQQQAAAQHSRYYSTNGSGGSSSGDGGGGANSNLVTDPSMIRNFAIIAHIDHGKTTLMDRLLAACGEGTSQDRAMDSHTLERERGITILAKVTSLSWRGLCLNAVDTPGHADFGGEVERVLGLVDGCVLLVDAAEGPLAQTKFVLAKALARGLRPIVLLNKVDRPAATPDRCGATANSVLDLLLGLGANEQQLDFPLLYSSAKQGWASRSLPPWTGGDPPPGASMAPLLETIASHVPPPPSGPLEQPFAMAVAMLERDPYIGRIATGRVASGRVRVGDKVRVLGHELLAGGGGRGGADADAAGPTTDAADAAASPPPIFRITRITKRLGVAGKVAIQEAVAGDIIAVAGAGAAGIADTIAAPEVTVPLDPGPVDPPTLSMVFGPNDSPLAGRAGKAVTGRAIGERLAAEAETSVSLKVKPAEGSAERWEVQARGELQLGVLLEGMRREGLELAVAPPQVLTRVEHGVTLEPFEEVVLEVADEIAGSVIDALTSRKAELADMQPLTTGKQRLVFIAPSRGLIGFKSLFVNMTRGEGLMARAFDHYGRQKGSLDGVRKGVMVSVADGRASTYALGELQGRGVFFIGAGADVYGGMVVGEHSREEDLEVNPVKEKKLTNVRSVQSEDKVYLAAPRVLSLEDAIGYVGPDELIEVTPTAVRIRKEILDANVRRAKARRQRQ